MEKNISLAQVKVLINNRDKILKVLQKGGNKSWLAPNDDTVGGNILDRMEDFYNNYNSYDIDQKEKALKILNSDYNKVVNYLTNVNTKLDSKKNSVNEDLNKDIELTKKENNKIFDELNKKPEEVKIKQESEAESFGVGMNDSEQENKRSANNNQTEKKENNTNNKSNSETYQGREIKFDPKTNEYSFESKNTSLGNRGGFKTIEEAKQEIDTGVKGYHLSELDKGLRGSTSLEFAKDFVNKYNKQVDLKSKGIDVNQILKNIDGLK